MQQTRVEPDEAATKTYQYLRLGMVGVVGLLTVSLAIEYVQGPGCLQDSISAYYFTPVRSIFVGGLMAIGAALIFISGRTLTEDVLLTIAGFFAPVVAVIPTTDVGTCYSSAPPSQPLENGELAPWVIAGVDNNVPALLVMGVLGLLAVVVIQFVFEKQGPVSALRTSDSSSRTALGIIAVVLAGGWWAYNYWGGFLDHAHGYSAVAMFGFLALAVASNAWENRKERTDWFWWYVAIAVAMPVAGLAVWAFGGEWQHAVFGLEAIEIGLFVAFWSIQTVRHWGKTVEDREGPIAIAA